jgi:hypothetical protein
MEQLAHALMVLQRENATLVVLNAKKMRKKSYIFNLVIMIVVVMRQH